VLGSVLGDRHRFFGTVLEKNTSGLIFSKFAAFSLSFPNLFHLPDLFYRTEIFLDLVSNFPEEMATVLRAEQ